jgi:hypothetical protein
MSSHGAECHAPQAAAANTSSLEQAGQGLFMIKFQKRFTRGKVFVIKNRHVPVLHVFLNPYKESSVQT